MIKSVVIHILMIFALLCFIYIIAIFATAAAEAQVLIILGALLFYSSPFINYLFRTFFYVGYYLWKSTIFGIKSLKCLEEHSTSHIVLFSDIDFFLHMNNGRYKRQMDFARLAFFGNSGLLQYSLKQGSSALMVAAVGRYRQPLNLFKRYNIKTKIEYWDNEKLYFKQNFVAPFKDQKDFVYSSNIIAMKTINTSPAAVLTGLMGQTPQPLEPSEEIQLFMSYIKTNSESFKKK